MKDSLRDILTREGFVGAFEDIEFSLETHQSEYMGAGVLWSEKHNVAIFKSEDGDRYHLSRITKQEALNSIGLYDYAYFGQDTIENYKDSVGENVPLILAHGQNLGYIWVSYARRNNFWVVDLEDNIEYIDK